MSLAPLALYDECLIVKVSPRLPSHVSNHQLAQHWLLVLRLGNPSQLHIIRELLAAVYAAHQW
jgi:hypothetical protein